jgi:hypothetical protein
MLKTYDYPTFFSELMDRAVKAERLPGFNKEMVEIFWDHVKKYSTDPKILNKALDMVIEHGEYLDPGNIIKYIPRAYPEEAPWPTFKDVKATTNIAQDCLSLVRRQVTEPISKEAFFEEMMKLHEKYPKAGFATAAGAYARKVGR